MNIIVLDLEWNQNSGGKKERIINKPIFEIIEIGAVKLNENYEIVDKFSQLIKPQIYHTMHKITADLINLQMKELNKGKSFPEVMDEFMKWCGEDYMFATWGPLDLLELQRNISYYQLIPLSDGPIKFYDVQKLFSLEAIKEKTRKTLEFAIDYFQIEKDIPFHRAFSDAYYTAKVFQKMNHKQLSDMYSIDYYHHPTCPEEEITSEHINYTEYITRTFHNKKEALSDKDIISIRCHKCNRKISKKIKWFVNNPTTQLCVGKCWTHGLMCGKLRFKTTKDGDVFVIKTIEKISKKEFERIRDRQNELRNKRREKRQQKKAV